MLEYFLMHFCGWNGKIRLLTTLFRVEKVKLTMYYGGKLVRDA